MRLSCPCCGASYSLEVLLADRSAREAVASALALPASLGERLLRYVGLFRPKERALSWDRAARLLTELQEAVNAAQIERDGRVYPAPVEYWRIAIDQMLDGRERLSLPLKSHGYLYEIIVGLGKRAEERHAARQEVDAERARAREGERGGRMQSAAAMVDAAPVARDDGAAAMGPPAPVRTPPPASFRALVARMTGKTLDGADRVASGEREPPAFQNETLG